MNLTKRIDQLELMDTLKVTPSVMEQTLGFLEITNTYFGGTKVILRHLENFSKHWPANESIKILDIGTGGGEIPIGIAQWARTKQVTVEITAIDLVPEIIEIAQHNTQNFPEIRVIRKNLWDFEEGSSKFDYVIGSLLLHHIPITEQIKFLQKLDRLTRRGILLSDLKRSRLNYWAVFLLSHLIGNKIVKHDGPLSVRRAFTLNELQQLAKETGLTDWTVADEGVFRLSLIVEKPQ